MVLMGVPVTRRKLFCFGSVALGSLLVKPRVVNAGNNPWHALPQWQRNQAIVDATYRDLDGYGGQCKVWAQNVVWRASKYHVWLPPNAPDAYGWYWRQDQHTVGMSKIIEHIRPGEIIQMHWRKADGAITPHTAIVVGVSSFGMYWVDSNFVQRLTVGLHRVSYGEFRSRAVSYSVYYVL